MGDDPETLPIVSQQRYRDAVNVLTCLEQSRWVAHSAGEWAAGAIEQIEDPIFQARVRQIVAEWHVWETGVLELQEIARRRLLALQKPARVTIRPGRTKAN